MSVLALHFVLCHTYLQQPFANTCAYTCVYKQYAFVYRTYTCVYTAFANTCAYMDTVLTPQDTMTPPCTQTTPTQQPHTRFPFCPLPQTFVGFKSAPPPPHPPPRRILLVTPATPCASPERFLSPECPPLSFLHRPPLPLPALTTHAHTYTHPPTYTHAHWSVLGAGVVIWNGVAVGVLRWTRVGFGNWTWRSEALYLLPTAVAVVSCVV
jgi:hypothetical protein